MTLHRLAVIPLMLLVLTACGGNDGDDGGEDKADEPESPLALAYDECAPELETSMQDNFQEDAPAIDEVVRVEDDGESLIISTPDPGGEIASSLAFIAATCILEETDAPATVSANMSSTTAVSGSQTTDWDNIEVVWSYAAGYDNAGFNATFALTD